MNKVPYLNVGCGGKFHAAWTNVDMTAAGPQVLAHDLLAGIPFPDSTFEAVYHSQVLEHFPKEQAQTFAGECLRVLRPGGILRVVVPDLENIAREYLRLLEANLKGPDSQAEAEYDWIMLELYDQAVRSRSGGQMAEYLRQPHLPNEEYVLSRIGRVGRDIRAACLAGNEAGVSLRAAGLRQTARRLAAKLGALFSSRTKEIGRFRLGGEIHLWMYDRFSLARLLRAAGFEQVELKTPYESGIPEWASYALDVRDGAVCDPTSLFMEARRPGRLA